METNPLTSFFNQLRSLIPPQSMHKIHGMANKKICFSVGINRYTIEKSNSGITMERNGQTICIDNFKEDMILYQNTITAN